MKTVSINDIENFETIKWCEGVLLKTIHPWLLNESIIDEVKAKGIELDELLKVEIPADTEVVFTNTGLYIAFAYKKVIFAYEHDDAFFDEISLDAPFIQMKK